jgi:hypothetical protein
MIIAASPLLLFAFIVLPVLVAIGWLAGLWIAWRATGATDEQASRVLVRAGLLTLAWMIGTLALAASRVLLHFDWRPPPMALLVFGVVLLASWIGGSSVGARLARGLPLAALVGFQAFRWPLEVLMHRGYVQNFVPVQMTYAGRNFDVLTGISAVFLAIAMWRLEVPRVVVLAWNVVGSVLLANILVIAVLSMPMIRFFGPDRMNVWVAVPPFVWLPTVLVVAALAGLIVVFRKLRLQG